MKLKIRRSTKNKVVAIELETIEFTAKEHSMLDQLGEPLVEYDKTYGNNTVKFAKKIRTGFKVKLKFDAKLELDTEKTAEYIEEFIESIQEKLATAMGLLEEDYNEALIPKEQIFEIEY